MLVQIMCGVFFFSVSLALFSPIDTILFILSFVNEKFLSNIDKNYMSQAKKNWTKSTVLKEKMTKATSKIDMTIVQLIKWSNMPTKMFKKPQKNYFFIAGLDSS